MNAKVVAPHESHAKVANIQQLIMAINALSKVLSRPLFLYMNYRRSTCI